MQHHTSTTDPGLRGSLWIDQAHHHRLVEVIRVLDNERVLMQPVRDARLKPPELPRDHRAPRRTRLPAGDAMTTSTTPKNEERAARDRLKAIERARAANAKANARRRADVIRDELARPRAKDCRCPITPASTLEQLRALGAGCTAGRWVCPTLDAIRRRLGA